MKVHSKRNSQEWRPFTFDAVDEIWYLGFSFIILILKLMLLLLLLLLESACAAPIHFHHRSQQSVS